MNALQSTHGGMRDRDPGKQCDQPASLELATHLNPEPTMPRVEVRLTWLCFRAPVCYNPFRQVPLAGRRAPHRSD